MFQRFLVIFLVRTVLVAERGTAAGVLVVCPSNQCLLQFSRSNYALAMFSEPVSWLLAAFMCPSYLVASVYPTPQDYGDFSSHQVHASC